MGKKKLLQVTAGIIALLLATVIPVSAAGEDAKTAGNDLRTVTSVSGLRKGMLRMRKVVADAAASCVSVPQQEAAEQEWEPLYAEGVDEPVAYSEAEADEAAVDETAYEGAGEEDYDAYEDEWYDDSAAGEDWDDSGDAGYTEDYEDEDYTEDYSEEDDGSGYTDRSSVSGTDLDLLASIIYCEAGGESYEGQVAVGAVVLNRMESGLYPDDMTDVIYQDWQFTPAMTGWLDQVRASGAPDYCYEAAQAALDGENPVGDCLYFHAGGGDGLTIGNQTFY